MALLPILSLTAMNLVRGATSQERSLLQTGILRQVPLPRFLGEVDKIVGGPVRGIMQKVEGGLNRF